MDSDRENYVISAEKPIPDPLKPTILSEMAKGLVGVSTELTPELILKAYRKGIFPWFNEDEPILWWFLNPRMVLDVKHLLISHSLKKRLKKAACNQYNQSPLQIRLDSATEEVLQSCSKITRRDQQGTWITDDIRNAYGQLAQSDHVHSVEVFIDGQLSGGLYGVSIGRMFYGESMFHRATDASKLALVILAAICRRESIPYIDCQQETPHLKSMGASPIPGELFVEHLNRVCPLPSVNWNKYRDADLCRLVGDFL